MEHQGAPASAQGLTARDVIFATTGTLVALALFALFGQLRTNEERLDEMRLIDLRTRASLCDLHVAIGSPEPGVCTFENLEEWRDSGITPGSSTASEESRRTRELLCLMADRDGIAVPLSLCPTNPTG